MSIATRSHCLLWRSVVRCSTTIDTVAAASFVTTRVIHA